MNETELDPFIVASRGRNPVNPSDRTAGIHTEQRLEPNMSGCSNTITTVQKDNYVCEAKIIVNGNIYPNSGNPQAGRIYGSEGISPSLDTCQGGNRMPKIVASELLALDEQNKYIRKDGCVGTLTTDGSSPKHNNRVLQTVFRIRKLTPSECYKLMGFTDEDCKKASDAGISNSQLYKQAGNSIVVQVMEALFRSLGEKYEDFRCPGITTSPD